MYLCITRILRFWNVLGIWESKGFDFIKTLNKIHKNLKSSSTEDHYIETNRIEALESDYLYIKSSQIKNAGKALFTAIDIYKTKSFLYLKGRLSTTKKQKKEHYKTLINISLIC